MCHFADAKHNIHDNAQRANRWSTFTWVEIGEGAAVYVVCGGFVDAARDMGARSTNALNIGA